MANNYLRYKYYLITRAAADEIYTAVQEIFMKMGVKPGAETAPSQKAAIHFTNAEEMKINASVAELLKHGALISLKGGATGDMKVSDSTGEEARIGTAFDLLSEMKLNSAHSSAIDEKTAHCLKMGVTMFRRTILADFNEKQLSEMDIKTLSQLLYVENTN